MNTNKIAF